MAHSGKSITFAMDVLPNENNIYSLGSSDKKWKIFGDVTGNVSGSAGSVAWEDTGHPNTFPPESHTHGNITNDGKMSGSTVSGTVTTSHKFLREDGTWQTPAYTTNTDEKVKVAALTSGTTYYPILATTAGTATRQVDTTLKGLSYISTAGTTSAVGTAVLALGNNTAKGTANNEQGVLRLYGTTAYYVDIKMEDGLPAASRTMYLPSYAGTMYMVAATTTNAVGSTTKPIYIDNTGTIQEGTALKNLAYIDKPSSNTTTTWLRGDGTWVAPPNDDTHHTAYLYAGANNATAHAAVSAGTNIYLCLRENSTQRSAVQIKQGTNMTISSDANGIITFASTDTNNAVTHTVKTTTKYYVTGTETATTSTGGDTFDTGIYATTEVGQLNATSYKVNENVTLQYNTTDSALEFVFG